MKALTAALSAALGAPVQQPAVLVEMAFSAPRRWSSFATLAWGGQTWQREAISIEGLDVQPLSLSGTLVIANGDDVAGALVLSEGVQDRAVRIWGYDAAAVGAADVVWLADAVGASAEVSAEEVRIALRDRAEFMLAPRSYVTAQAGFNVLLPPSTVLRINGVDWQLSRSGS